MIYFLYGTDSFRLHQRVRELKDALISASPSLDYQRLDASNLTTSDFTSAILSQSLLASQKLVIIDNLISRGSDELKESMKAWLEGPDPLPDEVVVVFQEVDEPDKRTRLFKLLSGFRAEHYEPLKLSAAQNWLSSRVDKLGLKLSADVSAALVENFSGDLWRLDQELQKLFWFSGGKTIDKVVMEQLVPHQLNDNIFQTIDALANQDLRLANRLINSQLALGANEQQLLAMIAYQFRNIILVTALTHQGIPFSNLAAKSQLHPYVVKKTAAFAKNFSLEQLSRVFQILHRVDTAIKNGKTPPGVGLDILTAQIVSS